MKIRHLVALALAGLITIGLPLVGFSACNQAQAAAVEAAGPKCGIGTSPSCPGVTKAAADLGGIIIAADDEPEAAVAAPDAGVASGIGTSPSVVDDPSGYVTQVLNYAKSGAYYALTVILLIGAVQFARYKGIAKSGYQAILASVALGGLGTLLAALTSGATAVAALVAAFVSGALKGLEAAGVVRLVQKHQDEQAAKRDPAQ
jgi:hypothetical protein